MFDKASRDLLKFKPPNIVYIISYLPAPSTAVSYVKEGIRLYYLSVLIICLDFPLLTTVYSNMFKGYFYHTWIDMSIVNW